MWAQLAVTFVNSVTCAQLPVLCILQQQQQLALMHCVQVVVIMHATKCLLTEHPPTTQSLPGHMQPTQAAQHLFFSFLGNPTNAQFIPLPALRP